jgi:hypothetical protein
MILDDGITALKDLHFSPPFLDDVGYYVRTHYAHGRHLPVYSSSNQWRRVLK